MNDAAAVVEGKLGTERRETVKLWYVHCLMLHLMLQEI
jgi:hypothetical protein